ncbi:hypothetical protein E2C01_057584 [Portunus trituberculatus]|uniref:Peptidase S1A nudel domain-containing protein n=1 Tax=Portunus trituberculatus TaxID=210409 RepID=A0A5B7H1I2_PORTR|nr:hypothetical protein [Portunus trituberculatus]
MFGGSPWAASVYVKGEYRCGATLVHPRWLITSNTCMFGVRQGTQGDQIGLLVQGDNHDVVQKTYTP